MIASIITAGKAPQVAALGVALAVLSSSAAFSQQTAVASASPRVAPLEVKSGTFLDGFKVYRGSSQFFRDLINPPPLSPVTLRTEPAWKNPGLTTYSSGRFVEHARSIPFELMIAGSLLAYTGISSWEWGDSKFFVARERWFGRNTHNGGMDKIGHFFSSYIITDLLADRIRANSSNPAGAELTAGLFAFALMGGIEILDGYTKKYGFSNEDLIADALGIGFAVVRNLVPGMKEKVDLRFMFTPSSYERKGVTANGNRFLPPYRRQRYILAIKGRGFEALNNTPLRFAELHLGYDARGFHPSEKALGYSKQRNFYIGMGINLNEVLFGVNALPNLQRYRDTEPAWATQKLLEYVQVPYTSVYSSNRNNLR